jgi:hypothetical protein
MTKATRAQYTLEFKQEAVRMVRDLARRSLELARPFANRGILPPCFVPGLRRFLTWNSHRPAF